MQSRDLCSVLSFATWPSFSAARFIYRFIVLPFAARVSVSVSGPFPCRGVTALFNREILFFLVGSCWWWRELPDKREIKWCTCTKGGDENYCIVRFFGSRCVLFWDAPVLGVLATVATWQQPSGEPSGGLQRGATEAGAGNMFIYVRIVGRNRELDAGIICGEPG